MEITSNFHIVRNIVDRLLTSKDEDILISTNTQLIDEVEKFLTERQHKVMRSTITIFNEEYQAIMINQGNTTQ
jgi:hypothetical protein